MTSRKWMELGEMALGFFAIAFAIGVGVLLGLVVALKISSLIVGSQSMVQKKQEQRIEQPKENNEQHSTGRAL